MNDGFIADEVTTTLVDLTADIDIVSVKFGSKLEEKDLGDMASYIDLQLTGIKNMEESLVEAISEEDMPRYINILKGMHDDALRMMSFTHFLVKEIRFMVGEARGEIPEETWEDKGEDKGREEIKAWEEEDIAIEIDITKEEEVITTEPTTTTALDEKRLDRKTIDKPKKSKKGKQKKGKAVTADTMPEV